MQTLVMGQLDDVFLGKLFVGTEMAHLRIANRSCRAAMNWLVWEGICRAAERRSTYKVPSCTGAMDFCMQRDEIVV